MESRAKTLKDRKDEYAAYMQRYSNGKGFLPKDAKIQMFRDLCPEGVIEVDIPTKDAEAKGLVCCCRVYSNKGKDKILLSQTFAHRISATPLDAEEDSVDLYSAVRAAAVSDALTLAGFDLPCEYTYSVEESNASQIDIEPITETPQPTEDVSSGTPVEEPLPAIERPSSAMTEDNPVEDSAIQPSDRESEPPASAEKKKRRRKKDPDVEVQQEQLEVSEAENKEQEKSDVDNPKNTNSKDVSECKNVPNVEMFNALGISYEDAVQLKVKWQTKVSSIGEMIENDSDRLLLLWMTKKRPLLLASAPIIENYSNDIAAEIIKAVCIACGVLIV